MSNPVVMADLLQIPALMTPPNVTSQFPTRSSDKQSWYYVSATLTTIIPGILLLLRLYTKLYVVRKVDLTDCFIVISFILLIILNICARFAVGNGAGVHQWNISLHDVIGIGYVFTYTIFGFFAFLNYGLTVGQWAYIYQIIYPLTILLVKNALLLQYLRLFAPQKSINSFMWYSNRILIVANGICYISSTFVAIFPCSPREAFWNPFIEDSRCVNTDIHILFVFSYNILSDIIILILPSRAVWKLRISARKKAEIVLLFAVGLLACIADAIVIFYVTRVIRTNADVSYNILWEGLWATVEIGFGITVTCMFTLPKFVKAKGAEIQNFCSSLIQPVKSFKSRNFGHFTLSNKGMTASRGKNVNIVDTGDQLASDLSFADRHQDLESYPAQEDGYDIDRHQSIKTIDTLDKMQV